MGPTCSIIYENEPMEKNSMKQKPRLITQTFFEWHEIAASLLQGLMIMVGIIAVYQYAIWIGLSEVQTRSMVFLTLISANIFLTLVNRSTTESVIKSLQNKNNLIYIILPISILLTVGIFGFSFIRNLFQLEVLSLVQVSLAIGAGFVFVIWYEIVKWQRRLKP
jgi:Ca2+-transporting ATPase